MIQLPIVSGSLGAECDQSQDSMTWHGMIMDDAHQSLALSAVESLRKEPIVLKGFEELLEA